MTWVRTGSPTCSSPSATWLQTGTSIAGELEEYLDELEHITFTIEGSGGSTLNFAEAALLIQVSVGVEPVPGSSSSGLYIALDARHLRQASVRIVKADMQ